MYQELNFTEITYTSWFQYNTVFCVDDVNNMGEQIFEWFNILLSLRVCLSVMDNGLHTYSATQV